MKCTLTLLTALLLAPLAALLADDEPSATALFQESDPPAVMSNSDRLLPDQTETPRMKGWCDLHYGLFIHFNINTYGKGQHPGALPVSDYQPVKLDVDSWVRIAKDAGMKYAVLTAKHDSGFCLWDSKAPWHGKEFDYDVAATQYKTDVVRAFMDACKKYGVAPGLYYCLQDFYTGQGRKKGELQKDYFDLVKAHLTELTARYPKCYYYWIDTPYSAGADQSTAIYELLRRADPLNVVQFNAHLARPWTDDSEEVPSTQGPGTNVFEKSKGFGFPTDVVGSENRLPYGPVPKLQSWKGRQYFVGFEHCAQLGNGWFNTQGPPRSLPGNFKLYQTVRNYGGNLLLDIGPNREGRIDDQYVKALMELKAKIEPFEEALTKSKH